MVLYFLRIFTVISVAIPVLIAGENKSVESEQYWPQWRGPLGTGVAPYANPPVEWSETKNVRWKVELPGSGHSTPIIWKDRVFVTTAVPYGDELEPKYSGASGAHDNAAVTHHYQFDVLAINRADGKILWQRTVHRELPHEGGHVSGSLASASAVTDGEHVYAFFGSRGLYCLDMDGELQWKADLGEMNTKHGHGEGSSPVLYGDTLVVNWDHEGSSFVIAFHKRTGKQLWKVARDELTSWATPIVVENGGKPQLIVSGTQRIRAYDLSTGRVIWECGGMSANVVASPVAGDGIVFVGSSYGKRKILAIRYGGAVGDITETDRVLWQSIKGTPYVPSPLLYNYSLYFLSHYQGVLSRVNAKTGEEQPGRFRLEGIHNIYASPMGAAGRVYITDLDGTTLVISNEENPRFIALNSLDDSFSASAAAVGSDLFLRGRLNLYCISTK